MYSFLIDKCFAYETGPNRDKEKDSSNESKVATGSSVKGKQSGSKPSSVPERKSFAGTKGQGPPPKTSSSPPSSFPPIVCVGCGEQHYLDMCKLFLNKSINDRFDFVKSNRLCLRCLKTGHNVAMCNRNIKCNMCSGNHHRLLHRETVRSNVRNEGGGMDGSGNGMSTGNASGSTGSANSGTSGQSNNGSTATSSLGSVCALGSSKSVFLATAVVKVQGVNCTEMGRIFLDQGSEMTLITREFCERAKLKMEKSESPTMLVGITNDTVQLNYSVPCVLRSRYSNFSIAIKAEVVEKIPYAVNKSNVKSVIEGFSLQFGESTDLPYSSVDILLGSEYAEFVLKDKRQFVDGLVFRDSYFGYVISGSAERCSFFGQRMSFCGMSNLELSEQFRKFVDVEEIPDPKKEKVVEHELIDKHFESTYSIDQETGKFVVRLPLKESVKVLNGSFGKVCAMLRKSEIRRSDVVQKAYENIFDEYLSLKHMTKLSGEPDLKAYYMPHHVVSKGEDSHRIVFNASFTDNSGTSLNSHFLVGPKVQPDLAVNLIRFRRHLIGFVCDIFRMYRDILIHPDDRIFQRIVFRFNFNDEIEVFELNTLANGIGPASYIAPKCLEKVASFIKDSDKMVSDIIMRDFYMDNLATGTDSVEGAIVISRRVHEVLMKYGFPLRKYQSNSPEFLEKISSELIDTVKVCNGKKFVTLLGLLWYLDLDEIGVDIREEVLPSIVTKRVMLPIISKTFDILGILTPVMIRAKLLLQDLWKEGRLWDEEISVELKEEFAQFLSDLLLLRSYSIPRCYFRNCAIVKVQLIGYCDASVRAACAVVYVRSIDPDGIIRVNFVCSKSRLAPPKGAVIHRMELIAAVLLAKLIKFVSLELCIEEIFCFSDSQVVLSWIKIDPVKLKQFVSNRVSVINSLVDKSRWFYVEGSKNPADLGTRGITASKFLSSECWLKGANFLHENESFEQYVSVEFHLVEKIPEMKLENVCNVIAIVNHPVLSIVNYKSSFYFSISIVAWWIRYVRILRERCSRRKLGVWNKSLPSNALERKEAMKKLDRLTNEERDAAYTQIIRVTQYAGFMQEQESLLKGKPVDKKSKLYACTVKLDPNGIIRATGRTVNASFEYDIKYPIALPVNSRFLDLYILFVHDRFHHANISFVLNFVRAKFWVIGNLLSRIKFLIHRCVVCVRENGKCQVQLMGDLPAERITVTRPFSYVGIDLTGALSLKCTNHRSVKSYKVYLVFFVCMVTRAVHIEIVADLTTEEFLNSLVRFTSRRGLPCKIFSDNATNFVGALNVLNCSKFSKFLHENRIEWKTIAPRSPHQGGIWEAAVKAGKASLYRAIGNQRLTLLELHTVSTKVEAILNARPLAYRRNNSFVEPITPVIF
ncbi:uncharacterized protein LOC135845113 [Planococcus citri]|uniref:uncharacterized protein LOC135845113 n=1 Tax=Planococcus citri TaxID=170843 RepID=UPI0031F8CA24